MTDHLKALNEDLAVAAQLLGRSYYEIYHHNMMMCRLANAPRRSEMYLKRASTAQKASAAHYETARRHLYQAIDPVHSWESAA